MALGKKGVGQVENTTYKKVCDVLYRDQKTEPNWTDYIEERCRLDVYYPEGRTGFPTVVWFHGGGLNGGNRYMPPPLMEQGIAVVAVNHRLNPKVTSPTYIEDAAAAVAWVFHHMPEFGGDANLIFVAGHSAGGYLVSMIGLDVTYLAHYGVNANDLAGVVSFSGQTVTHATIRAERGIPRTRTVVDEMAPLFHARADCPPFVLVTGDRDLDVLGRYEENALLARVMVGAGHEATVFHELKGYDHGSMVTPACEILLGTVNDVVESRM